MIENKIPIKGQSLLKVVQRSIAKAITMELLKLSHF